MEQSEKAGIYWVIQDNQVTPFIVDFLEIMKKRVSHFLTLKHLVPSHNTDTLKAMEKLGPVSFQVSSAVKPNSFDGFNLKKELIGNSEFSEGLAFWRTVLLDDLGSGNLFRATIHHEIEPDTKAIILQIPTPLGSSASEERIFYAWIYLARQHNIPVFGYELLPLDTRWTLAPSLLDGVITRNFDSYVHLTSPNTQMPNKTWLLPRYEGRIFSPGCPPMWINALGCAYRHQQESKIDFSKAVIYVPHNVAMTHEYKKLISHLRSFKDEIHIMFSIGSDQVRGTHKHDEIIKIISREELKTISHSFHNLNRPWEMAIADCVAACSSCYATSVAVNNNIPTLIYDPMVNHGTNHNPVRLTSPKQCFPNISEFKKALEQVIAAGSKRTELARILFQLINAESETGVYED